MYENEAEKDNLKLNEDGIAVVTEGAKNYEAIVDKDKEKSLPMIDQLLNEGNYSLAQIKVIAFACLVMYIDGLYMMLLPSLFIPTKEYFNVTELQLSIISSTLFLGVGIGSISSSFGTKYYTRRQLLNFSLFVVFLMTICMIFVQTVFVFILVRLVIGIAIGILVPIMMNLMCEYLPIKFRSFVLISVNVFFNVAVVSLNVCMLYIMPNLEVDKLGLVYLLCSIPVLLIFFFFLVNLKESPRFLLLQSKYDEAFEIIQEIISRRLLDQEKEKLKEESTHNSNSQLDGNFSSIFSSQYISITLILVTLWMFCAFIIYGGTFTLSMVLTKVMKESRNQSIRSQIYVYTISSPGCIIGALLTEIQCLGRKTTSMLGFILITVCNTIGVIDNGNISTYFGLLGIFITISFNSIGCYSCEVYPTKIRDMALGFLYCLMRFSGFLSQFVAMLLMMINPLGLFYVTIAMGLISSIITFKLPYDTYGMALDSN